MRNIVFAVLLALATTACASSGAVPAPFPSPTRKAPRDAPRPPQAGSPAHASLIDTALSLRGTPYREGGADPSGFDCSGFVSYVFGRTGQAVPRTVEQQYQAGQDVPRDALEAGDLVFFNPGRRGPTHVGIALSSEQFVHAPSSSGVVRIESLTGSFWSSRFVAARRLR